MFSCEFCEIPKNTFFPEQLWWQFLLLVFNFPYLPCPKLWKGFQKFTFTNGSVFVLPSWANTKPINSSKPALNFNSWKISTKKQCLKSCHFLKKRVIVFITRYVVFVFKMLMLWMFEVILKFLQKLGGKNLQKKLQNSQIMDEMDQMDLKGSL